MPNRASSGDAATAYIEQNIRTSDPVALVARIFELASMHIARARSALAEGDLAAKGVAVNHASRCISLLQTTLDMERGGEVARNFDRLYAYLLRRLTDGHHRNDDGALAEAARHLGDLGQAWRAVSAPGHRGSGRETVRSTGP